MEYMLREATKGAAEEQKAKRSKTQKTASKADLLAKIASLTGQPAGAGNKDDDENDDDDDDDMDSKSDNE